jgi:hypothetical protein
MYTVKQGGRMDYNYKEYFLDDVSELELIDVEADKACPGSVAYIIKTGAVYILNSHNEWIAQ